MAVLQAHDSGQVRATGNYTRRAPRPSLTALDILVVWGTILWMMLAVWPHDRWVAAAQLPNFVWVSIATALQLSITRMNRA